MYVVCGCGCVGVCMSGVCVGGVCVCMCLCCLHSQNTQWLVPGPVGRDFAYPFKPWQGRDMFLCPSGS